MAFTFGENCVLVLSRIISIVACVHLAPQIGKMRKSMFTEHEFRQVTVDNASL